jgi:hypothetical protein
MAIQRPLKTYGTRKYVDEVAAAPNNTDPILASEVDADLDTMYTAFNALVVNATIAATAPATPVQGQLWWRNDPDGTLYISYNDGNSTQWVPAVPSSAPQWKVVGTALTPVDATKNVAIPGATTGADQQSLTLGSRTQKARIGGLPTFDGLWLVVNEAWNGSAWVRDDTAQPAGIISFQPNTTTVVNVTRVNASGSVSELLKLDDAGNLTLPAGASGSAGINKFVCGGAPTFQGFAANGSPTAPTPVTIYNQLATFIGTGCYQAGSNYSAQGKFYLYAHETWTATARGTSAQIDLTPVGSTNPSGHSFSFDHDGAYRLTGSYAQKATGTTWANPSDPRLKTDIGSYARGLAEITQLTPMSYRLKSDPDGPLCYGFDASAVREIFPECVSTRRMKLNPTDEEETDDVLVFDMHPILVALVNAVKELAGRGN